MTLLKSLMTGAAVAGLLCAIGGGAFAQGKGKGSPAPVKTQAELDRESDAKRVDKEYKAQLERSKNDPAPTKVNDPWANIRGANDSKTDPKTKR